MGTYAPKRLRSPQASSILVRSPCTRLTPILRSIRALDHSEGISMPSRSKRPRSRNSLRRACSFWRVSKGGMWAGRLVASFDVCETKVAMLASSGSTTPLTRLRIQSVRTCSSLVSGCLFFFLTTCGGGVGVGAWGMGSLLPTTARREPSVIP